jgi:outer membrane receptor protein involved in Fe transport
MGTEGNPNLKPETGWHTDATAEQTFFDSTGTATLCPYPGAGRSVFLSVGYEF